MNLSVAICTWNRQRLLGQTLAEMCHLRVPSGVDWELLVVNNNCTDQTDQVVQGYADRLPVRVLHESTPGKSHALNHAIHQARGDCVIWTDDDVLVDPNWITAYADAFRQFPDCSIFGGPIQAHFEAGQPAWLQRVSAQVKAAYGIRDFGPDSIPLSDEVVPFGANLAFRLAVQRRYLYDPSLGPSPDHVVQGGEETALVRRMLADGQLGRWLPEAKIRHVITQAETTTDYLWKFYFRAGHGKQLGEANGNPHELAGRRQKLVRQSIQARLRFHALRWISRPERWIEHLKFAAKTSGQLDRLQKPRNTPGG